MNAFTVSLVFLSLLVKIRFSVVGHSGRVASSYFGNEKTSKNGWSCYGEQCETKNNCAITFDKKTKKCYRLYLSAQILQWDYSWGKRLFKDIHDNRWSTKYRSIGTKVPHPTIMWLLDGISKGENIGTASDNLDIPTDPVDWTQPGPREGYPQKYGRSHRAINRLLFKGGFRLIDLSGQFTMALWIKTDPSRHSFVVVDAKPKTALRFMLFPGLERNRLSLGIGDPSRLYGKKLYAASAADSSKVNDWRHVAVVFYSTDYILFFLEGKQLATTESMPKFDASQPTDLVLWSNNELLSFSYKGSYACVSIHQQALSLVEIQALRSSCP